MTLGETLYNYLFGSSMTSQPKQVLRSNPLYLGYKRFAKFGRTSVKALYYRDNTYDREGVRLGHIDHVAYMVLPTGVLLQRESHQDFNLNACISRRAYYNILDIIAEYSTSLDKTVIVDGIEYSMRRVKIDAFALTGVGNTNRNQMDTFNSYLQNNLQTVED